jgi:hypothetical protein
MKARTARLFGAWIVVAASAALLLQGCVERNFVVRKQQVVATVNAQGRPGTAKSQFTTADSAAYCWFEYLNAPGNKPVKCEIAYTDPNGTTHTRSENVVLKPGNHKVHFGVEMPRGEGLKAGSYEAQAYDGERALFGTPLRFTVVELPGQPATTAPGMDSSPEPASATEPSRADLTPFG